MTTEQQIQLIEILGWRALLEARGDRIRAGRILARLIRDIGFRVVAS